MILYPNLMSFYFILNYGYKHETRTYISKIQAIAIVVCELSRIILESPRYKPNLRLSCASHQISWKKQIKAHKLHFSHTFWPIFCILFFFIFDEFFKIWSWDLYFSGSKQVTLANSWILTFVRLESLQFIYGRLWVVAKTSKAINC